MLKQILRLSIVLNVVLATGACVQSADQAQVDAAIRKGQQFLVDKLKESGGAQRSIAAYALVKSGMNKADAGIQEAVAGALKAFEEHYSPGMPRFGQEFAYTVPCHMFLLEAVDPEVHKAALEAMAGFLVQHQQANGSWFYSNVPSDAACDTSQTQFALFGLWAAARAGIAVDQTSVQRAVNWLMSSQKEGGGFAYQPWAGSQPHEQEPFLLTTLSGVGAVLTAREILFPGVKFGDELAPRATKKPSEKKYGVLDRLQDEQGKAAKETIAGVSIAAIDKSIARSVRFVDANFTVTTAPPHDFVIYQLYAMERMAALLDSDDIGQHDWYEEASNQLIRLQLADGSWSDRTGAVPSTSLAILCLNRATAQILGKTPAKKVGGGLLAGARGLPTDLSKLQLKDGQAVERKSKGEVDDLLAELEKVQNVSVSEVQKAIVESVNLDDPEQLVGQIDRLRRLAKDPRTEVRRTALWAIGRTGEIRLAPLLIKALSDVDVDVIQEASYGLTVLSRKPTGIRDDQGKRIPVEPLDGLEEDATDEQRQKHLEHWLALAIPAWQKWYLQVRPYDERDDRQTLKKSR